MLIFRRNQIVITSLIVVILCAGYLNYKYNNTKVSQEDKENPIGSAYYVDNSTPGSMNAESVPAAKVNGDFFVITRAEKERTRDEQKDMMESIINNKNVDKETKTKAQSELIRISKNMEKEMIVEGLLRGKGFNDVLAYINDDKVDIVLKDDTNLIPSQQAMIIDVVTRETGATTDNIKINPYKNSN